MAGATERILGCERRLRADGLLAPDAQVPSIAAWNHARAVNLARWGLVAGYCDRATAELVVLRAGDRCRARYDSWEELSAGYLLGHELGLPSGDGYPAALRAHRLLTIDPASPWRRLRLHDATSAPRRRADPRRR